MIYHIKVPAVMTPAIYKKFQKVVSVRKKLLEYLDRGFVHKFVSKKQQTFLNTKQLEFLDPGLMHKFVSEYTKKVSKYQKTRIFVLRVRAQIRI